MQMKTRDHELYATQVQGVCYISSASQFHLLEAEAVDLARTHA